jgi:hypothetical protein
MKTFSTQLQAQLGFISDRSTLNSLKRHNLSQIQAIQVVNSRFGEDARTKSQCAWAPSILTHAESTGSFRATSTSVENVFCLALDSYFADWTQLLQSTAIVRAQGKFGKIYIYHNVIHQIAYEVSQILC